MGEPDYFCVKCGAYWGDEKIVPEVCTGTSFAPNCGGEIKLCEPSIDLEDDESEWPSVRLTPIDDADGR